MNFIDECNVVIDRLDAFSFKMIQNEIQEFQHQLSMSEPTKSHDQVYAFQQRVVGDLQFFQLPRTKILIENKVLELILLHEKKYRCFDRIFNRMVSFENTPIFEFERIWVNVQRQSEFIPLHQHSGVYSFVIWLQIPYIINEQQNNDFNKILHKNRTSMFEFVYVDSFGKLQNVRLPVDKTWEGKIAVFPAELHHQVYPFYGTDELRISISGNVRLSPKTFI
jgi:hypothetical protein